MPRQLNKLTQSIVLRTNRPGNYSDGGGLYLRVGPTGAKSWIFRYRVNGKLTDMGLGSVNTFNLHEARGKVHKLRQELDAFRHGEAQHPLAARREAQRAMRLEAVTGRTFRQCAETYIAERTWKNPKHAQQWPTSLATYVYAKLGDLPVSAIDTPLVLSVLKPIWTTKPETANRVRGRVEAILGWATVNGFREGDNPARWRNHLDKALQQPSKTKEALRRAKGRAEHLAALPYRELPQFMTALRQQDGIAARALEFTILTAARAGEVLNARWSEINQAERVWTVPAERMKSGKEHRVPLSDAALSVLSQLDPNTGVVFPRLGRDGMLRLMGQLGRAETVHGFRSTFSDWCTECTQFPTEVREMALAHTVGSAVERAYRRTDLFAQRAKLAEAWERHCRAQAASVVALRPSA